MAHVTVVSAHTHCPQVVTGANTITVCVCAQSCLTLCEPMDCGLTGSSVHGMSQARILWSGLPLQISRVSTSCHTLDDFKQQKCIFSWFWKLLLLLSRFSRVQLCATPQMAAHQAPPSLGFSRKEHWSGLPLPSPSDLAGDCKCPVSNPEHVGE